MSCPASEGNGSGDGGSAARSSPNRDGNARARGHRGGARGDRSSLHQVRWRIIGDPRRRRERPGIGVDGVVDRGVEPGHVDEVVPVEVPAEGLDRDAVVAAATAPGLDVASRTTSSRAELDSGVALTAVTDGGTSTAGQTSSEGEHPTSGAASSPAPTITPSAFITSPRHGPSRVTTLNSANNPHARRILPPRIDAGNASRFPCVPAPLPVGEVVLDQCRHLQGRGRSRNPNPSARPPRTFVLSHCPVRSDDD